MAPATIVDAINKLEDDILINIWKQIKEVEPEGLFPLNISGPLDTSAFRLALSS